jgi:hypothetical protein
MEKVLYSAVVLDNDSHTMLVNAFKTFIPKDFKIYAHHMTINMGELKEEYRKYLGMTVMLKVVALGIDEKVIAVKVEGFPTVNKIPHVTLAVDVNNGGKPVMSNNITEWQPVKNMMFMLKGVVQEIKSK